MYFLEVSTASKPKKVTKVTNEKKSPKLTIKLMADELGYSEQYCKNKGKKWTKKKYSEYLEIKAKSEIAEVQIKEAIQKLNLEEIIMENTGGFLLNFMSYLRSVDYKKEMEELPAKYLLKVSADITKSIISVSSDDKKGNRR